MSHQARPHQPDALNVDRGLESLQSSAEFPGPVEPLDEAHRHHCNDHIALIHESPEEQFAAVVPFVRQGLAVDERCLYVVEDTAEEIVVSMDISQPMFTKHLRSAERKIYAELFEEAP